MQRLLIFLLCLIAGHAWGQSVPNGTITQGLIWTPAQWNFAFQSKVDTAGGICTNCTLNGTTVFGAPIGASYLPVATGAAQGIVKGDGSTLTITLGTIACTTATTSQIGCVKPDGSTIAVSAGVISVPTGTSSAKGVLQTDGSTISNAAGTISCTTATASQLGCVKPDGSTIAVSSGTISVPAGTNAAKGVVQCDGTTINCASGVASTIGVHQTLYTNGTLVGNGADTTEDTLMTYTIPANTLANVGDRIEIKASARMSAITDVRYYRIRIGGCSGTIIALLTSASASMTAVSATAWVLKTGSNAQSYGSLTGGTTQTTNAYAGTASLTDTSTIQICVTGQDATAATANVVQAQMLLVDFIR